VARFGQYITVLSVVTVAGALTDIGMGALATREYAVRVGDDRDRRSLRSPAPRSCDP
jgi:O-antigen/teichoic acid export membrane protein